MDVQKEQRYQDDGNGGKIRKEGRPGDIKINNYFTTTSIPKDATHRDLYIDFTVGNIFANTYINTTSKKRGELAKKKENHKDSKYHNSSNIMGVGIECLGIMSKNGKKIIKPIFSLN